MWLFIFIQESKKKCNIITGFIQRYTLKTKFLFVKDHVPKILKPKLLQSMNASFVGVKPDFIRMLYVWMFA